MPDNPYRTNVSAIAMKNDKYLIVHKPREEDAWQFPQGGVDEGETKEEALLREFKEEVGTNNIEIMNQSPHVYQYDFPEGFTRYSDSGKEYKGQQVHFYFVNFLGEDTNIQLDPHELDDYKWVTKEELPQYFLRKEYLAIVERVITPPHTHQNTP